MEPNAADRWELDSLSRIASARDVADAIVCGHLSADPELVGALAQLVESAAQRLRWRDACTAEDSA